MATTPFNTRKTLHIGGLVEAALPLLEVQVPPDASRYIQRTNCTRQKRYSAPRRDRLFQGPLVDLEKKLTLGRTACLLILVALHHCNITPQR